MLISFDVATVPARLSDDGRRDISRPVWSRVVVEAPTVTRGALVAAQVAGCRGMVVDLLLRE